MVKLTDKKTGKPIFFPFSAHIVSIVPTEEGGTSLRIQMGERGYMGSSYIAFHDVEESTTFVAKAFGKA